MLATKETQFIADHATTLRDLERYKELKIKEANLTAELEQVKNKLLNGWFCTHETIESDNGLVLATAKIQKSVLFNQSQFKEEHPALYEQYKNKEVISQPLRLTKYF